MKKGHLFIICGASGSGKSTLTEMIGDNFDEITRAPKYSTRKFRPVTPSNPVEDDIIQVKREDFFGRNFDLAYVANDNYYGVKKKEIFELIEAGNYLLLSITDFRAVFRFKEVFGGLCSTIALLSAIDPLSFISTHGNRDKYDPDNDKKQQMEYLYQRLASAARLNLWREVFANTLHLIKIWQSTVPDIKQAESRTKKVRDFQTRFLENSHHFDFSILNYRKGLQRDMLSQFSLIFDRIRLNISPPSISKKTLLVVAAASGSGKGTLLENLKIIAPNEVLVVEKEGKRKAKDGDKDDGLKAIGKEGVFSDGFNLVYQMHRDPKTGVGTQYAFSEAKIHKGFESHDVQVAIANVLLEPELLDSLKNAFGNAVKVVYLMRFGAEDKIEEYQMSRHEPEKAKLRILQHNETYTAYTNSATNVDHVLLNTENREDLYDQMFRLLEFYKAV